MKIVSDEAVWNSRPLWVCEKLHHRASLCTFVCLDHPHLLSALLSLVTFYPPQKSTFHPEKEVHSICSLDREHPNGSKFDLFISVISGPGRCLENTAARWIQLSLISFPSKRFSARWVAFNHLLFIWFSVSGWWFFSSSRKWENILSLRTIISTLSFPREARAGLASFEYMLHILCLINYHS